MNRTVYTLMIASFLFFAPTVAADDGDPTYEVPDAAVVADAAQTLATDSAADAGIFGGAAAGEAQSFGDDALVGQLGVSHVQTVIAGAEGFATATEGRAGATAGTGADFANSTANTKIDEVGVTADAAKSVAFAATGAARTVLDTAYGVLCASPLVTITTPENCGADSIVAAALEAAGETSQNAASEANNQAGSSDEVVAEANAFFEDITGESLPA